MKVLLFGLLLQVFLLALPSATTASHDRILLHDLTRTRTLLRASLRRERELSSVLKSYSLSPSSAAVASSPESSLPSGALAALEAAALEETSRALESMAAGARIIIQEAKQQQRRPSSSGAAVLAADDDADSASASAAQSASVGAPIVSALLVSDLECRLRLESDRADEEGARADEEAAKVRKLVETMREGEEIREGKRLKAKDRLVSDLQRTKSKDFAGIRRPVLNFRMFPSKVGINK